MNEQQHSGRQTAVGKVAIVGSMVQMSGRALRALAGIGTIAILARFLTPADFGSFALIFSLVMLAQVFADLGLRVSLVQRAQINDIECQSVFWTSTLSGAALTALLMVFSAQIATLFQNPELAIYIIAVSPIFILVGMRGVPLALLERRFEFKKIAGAELAAALFGSATAIAFALAGSTVGALVAQQIAMVVVMAAMLFYQSGWLPRFKFSLAALKPLSSYGNFVTVSGILHAGAPMVNRLLIGTRLSTADLGFLTMSDQIMQTPVRIIAASIRRVTFPLLSSFQNDNARIVTAHQSTLHALSLTLAPCAFGIAALSEPVARLVLGPEWAPIAIILALVSPRALTNSVGEMHSAVFSAKGKARFQFKWGVVTFVLRISLLLAMIPFGLEAIVIGQLALAIFVTVPVYTWFLARLLETTTLGLLLPMARPILAAVTMAVTVYLADQFLRMQDVPIIVRAILGPLLGGPIYLGLILLIDRERSMPLLSKMKSIRRGKVL